MGTTPMKQLDHKKVEKVIEIAHKLGLEYALVHKADGVVAVYYFYNKTDLGQYVELCRRLANSKFKVVEEFVDDPMDSPSTRPIGTISAKIPVLRTKP